MLSAAWSDNGEKINRVLLPRVTLCAARKRTFCSLFFLFAEF